MSVAVDVLFADNHLLVVRKPACVPCVPDESGDESLLDAAKAWIKREHAKPGAVFLGVVQRLDRPVSGVLVFARTSKAAERLTAALKERRVQKTYWGVVDGGPRERSGELEQWLEKDQQQNRALVRAPGAEGAKQALTRWRVLRTAGGRSLLELQPRSGRPHQLRVACAALGHPLLGDLKYGAREPLADRSIALHARALELEHPVRRETVLFEAAPPELDCWRIARE